MRTLFSNASVYKNGNFEKMNFLFDGKSLSAISDISAVTFDKTVDGAIIIPGFCDVHVHFREPGFSYKETIKTGSLAAAHGGYTAVCTMPNLSPVPDSEEHLKEQTDIIKKDAVVNVIPFGAITVNEAGEELADIPGMKDGVVGYSDDGRGVQSEELMLKAMNAIKNTGKVLSAHCEDNSLLFGGYIHDGEYAKAHGHLGICSKSEWAPIERDLKLVEKSGVKYHVCHVSTKESVQLIREAKAKGIDVTCETAPHYLVLDERNLEEDARFKMNPPLRAKADKEALILGILDGTIDMIATDHAPHSADEKAKGLKDAPMGVVGLETAFAVMYTEFVKTEILTLEKLIQLMSDSPRARFGINSDVGFTVFDVNCEFNVNPDSFLSKGRATPFKDAKLFGECLLTVYNDKAVYISDKIK